MSTKHEKDTYSDHISADVKAVLRGHTAAINQLSISLNSEYLASVADDGCLLIYNTPSGRVIRRYWGQHMLRAVAWHPHDICVITGASNGEIVLTTLGNTVAEDVQDLRKLPGFIHLLAYNIDGSILAVAYGDKVGLLSVEGKTSELRVLLDGPLNDSAQIPNIAPCARSICFLNPEELVVVYLNHGIIGYSTATGYARWRIDQRYMGCASTHAPTSSLLAITNILGNVEWFSLGSDINEKCFLKETTVPEVMAKRVTGIVNVPVVSGDLVAVGATEGAVYFSRFQDSKLQGVINLHHKHPVQAMASWNLAGEVFLAVGSWCINGTPEISIYMLGGVFDRKLGTLGSVASVIQSRQEATRNTLRLNTQSSPHLVAHLPHQMLRYALHSFRTENEPKDEVRPSIQTLLNEWEKFTSRELVSKKDNLGSTIKPASEAIQQSRVIEKNGQNVVILTEKDLGIGLLVALILMYAAYRLGGFLH